MKNTKIVALVAAVALLVLGTAFASFAATYNWYQADGEWRCADKDGEDYYDAWAKSGDGWYYLGEEGYMLREAVIEVDGGSKYVDADGRMVTNDWKKVSNDDGDEFWMYFQANGKSVPNKKIKVGDNSYIFDADGYMLSGWVTDEFQATDDWFTAAYYCGDENDGAVKLGWQALTVDTSNEDFGEDFDETEYWFWFSSKGEKFAATEEGAIVEKSINGKTYAFDDFGRMQAEWQYVNTTAASSSIAGYAWFQSVEIGAKFANGWFRTVPTDAVDKDNDGETSNWFYAKKGNLAYSEIKTINGKKYGFNAYGEMVSGLQVVTLGDEHTTEFDAVGDDISKVTAVDPNTDAVKVYFFSADEENDGSMKFALQTVTVDDDDYSFYFDKQGRGITNKQGGKYYYNGLKIAANEDKADYQVFPALVDGDKTAKIPAKVEYDGYTFNEAIKKFGKVLPANEYAVISKTGVIGSSGTKKDGNYFKAVFSQDKDNKQYYWTLSSED